MAIKALLFDVFGTCVDWRSGVIREGTALASRFALGNIDWAAFADAWRALYQPQLDLVRSGKREWVNLDVLHWESLSKLTGRFGLETVAEQDLREFNRVWHRLDPWPDTIAGLTRLKSKYVIAPNSNGHIALMVTMAKRAGIPWDAILGAEVSRAYKPKPEAYLKSVEALGMRPEDVMMVAAHNYDLKAASTFGLKTGFVARAREYGEQQTSDLAPSGNWDVVAADFEDLASKLGC